MSAEYLRVCVLAADVAAARNELTALLSEKGEQYSKLAARKGWRADAFRVEGDSVYFEIERHPGMSFLTHRKQIWKVMPDGAFVLVREAVERITLERLVAMATREDRCPRTADARAAIEYARETGRDDGTEDPEDIALGWVALATWGRKPHGRFPGTVADMASALDDGSGLQTAAERLADARGIADRARKLWAELRAPKGAK